MSPSTISLVVVAMRKNSPLMGTPLTSSSIFCARLPSATAVMIRPTSAVGWARLLMSALIESAWLAHEPATAPSEARSVISPSSPTVLLTRANSFAVLWFKSTTSLNVSAISLITPFLLVCSLTEKSPSLAAFSALSNDLSWALVSPPMSTTPSPIPTNVSSCWCPSPSGSWSSKKTERPALRASFILAMLYLLNCFQA